MNKSKTQSRSLGKAWKLYKRKNYSQVIRFLEPQVFRYRENFDFYYILGTSCLYMGDYGGAYSYLKRCHSLNPRDLNTHLALAVVYLKRRNTEEALRSWLTILDEDEKHKIADKGMKQIRSHGSPEEIEHLFDSGKIRKFFPERPRDYRWIFPTVTATALFLTLLLVLGPMALKTWKNRNFQRLSDPALILGDKEELTSLAGEYEVILTESQVMEIYKKGLDYFNRFEDNLARREFNRLLIGNASAGIKAKAETMISHIQPPKFSKLKHRFTFLEVIDAPLIYDGTYVVWSGKVSDVSVSDDLISFRFLVGYHEEKVIDGIISAYLDFPAQIDPSNSYEFLGQVETLNSHEIQLKVIGVHRINPNSGDES